ncbi:MAG: thioredoxin-dependent thiol peroxidase [Elusimicrobia bacterium]|nr:thioredoxin-dependent thiol peroxidase [Elusimicrobiota bacterium]
MTLAVGDKAPDFTLYSADSERITLSELTTRKRRAVVVFFYPKDDTPGCTTEACGFRDQTKDFSKKNAVILGVSADSIDSHVKFKKKFGLPFQLLADTDKKAIEAYGVWKEKSMYGRKYMGIERTTFVIGADGRIQKIFPKVSVTGHVDAVLATLS